MDCYEIWEMEKPLRKEMDYYEILGIEKDATIEQIKVAYAILAHDYSLERTSKNKVAEANFTEITQAYKVLSDPDKKRKYDIDIEPWGTFLARMIFFPYIILDYMRVGKKKAILINILISIIELFIGYKIISFFISSMSIEKIYLTIGGTISLSFHEFAHAWVTQKLGDDTPVEQGRVTLNPIAHISLLGTIFLLIIGLGWAKPVYCNPNNFKNPEKDLGKFALAGPVMNFLLAILFFIILCIFYGISIGFKPTTFDHFMTFVIYNIGNMHNIDIIHQPLSTILNIILNMNILLIVYNIVLGILNLLPFPPLDGSKVLLSILPQKVKKILHSSKLIKFIIFVITVIFFITMISLNFME